MLLLFFLFLLNLVCFYQHAMCDIIAESSVLVGVDDIISVGVDDIISCYVVVYQSSYTCWL